MWDVRGGVWHGYAAGLPVTLPRFRARVGPAPRPLLANPPPPAPPLLERPPNSTPVRLDFAPPGDGAPFGPPDLAYIAEVGSAGFIGSAVGREVGHRVVTVDLAARLACDRGSGVGVGGGGGTAGVPCPERTFMRARPDALGPPGLEHSHTAGLRRPVDLRFRRASPATGDPTAALYVVDLGALLVKRGRSPRRSPARASCGAWCRPTRHRRASRACRRCRAATRARWPSAMRASPPTPTQPPFPSPLPPERHPPTRTSGQTGIGAAGVCHEHERSATMRWRARRRCAPLGARPSCDFAGCMHDACVRACVHTPWTRAIAQLAAAAPRAVDA